MTGITEKLYSAFLSHPEISTDIRNVPSGCLFFALKGDNFDGNAFAERALKAGAAWAIVDDPRFIERENFIVVDNVLATLQELAAHHRRQFDIPLLAITGTNGKTTTKELINAVLSRKFRTIATAGNLNNHIGVPLTLLKINNETEFAVIEMGANHPGEIDFLCRIAAPDFGIITNIGRAHLEGFGGYEGVIRTKTEMYRYLGENDGLVFVNTSDPVLMEHATRNRTTGYGIPPAFVQSAGDVANPYSCVSVKFPDQSQADIQSQLVGAYNAANILAAACIGYYFGVPAAEIKTAIESYKPVNNRSQVVKTERNTLICDYYNANPSSMLAALESFAGSDYAEKCVILGDMLELGTDTDEEHLNIMKAVERLGFQQVYLVGQVFTRLNKKRENICFDDSELAKMWLGHHRITDATILVKGSRGIHLEKVAEEL